jgi:TIR domain
VSHVLVSYKREDEPRVARLIRALQHHGLTIWWDQGLPGGEEWRANIEKALTEAACVVVVWSHGSVGPEGEFVRDEAARAKGRGILVPTRLDKVMPPLGFGEIQAVDLSGWRGNPNDPSLRDLVEAVKAKLDGRAAPPAKAPGRRLLRRAAIGTSSTAVLMSALAFAGNMFATQDRFCTIPIGQPGLSDACGAVHVGGRPSYAERLAWAKRRPGSCADLQAIIKDFPDGAYRSKAADLLQAAAVSSASPFAPDPRTARGYVRQSMSGFGSAAAAQADATTRAIEDAKETTCAPVDANERLDGVEIASTTFDCRPSPLGGTVCAADYVATCRLEARQAVCG